MGFLSAYSGVRRVPIGDTYWVDLKEHLLQRDKEKGDRALQHMQVVEGKPQINPDVVEFRQQLVLASVHDWNLDEDNGQIWPINMQNVKRLPSAVFDELWAVIDKTNEPRTTAEQRQFPAGAVGGGPDGDAGAAEPVDVPDPGAVLETPGDDQG